MIFKFNVDWKIDPNNNDRGSLLPIESLKNIPFDIKRFFLIKDVNDNQKRGYHSHKKCKQVFVLIQGSIDIEFDNGLKKEKYFMRDINEALYVPENIWCVMENISKDCILLVVCSEYYDENEYCRNYDEFLNIVKPEIKVPMLDMKETTQRIKKEVLVRMNNVIDNTSFVLGKELKIFEESFAKYIGTKYCVGMSNGTATMISILKSLNLSRDDEVLTQANTYIAAPLAISQNNLKISLVDCCPDSLAIDLDELEKKITKKTKVIIVVHLYGACCNMERLVNICKKNNIFLLEDAAQAHGSTFNGKKLGSFGDAGSFSFYPSKNLGGFGESGCVVTNDNEIYKKILMLRNYGSIDKYKWEIKGLNERMDTLQAAILNVKLKYLDEWNQNRNKIADIYNKELNEIEDIKILKLEPNTYSCYHLYVIKVKNREALMKYLKDNNVSTAIHYPVLFYQSEAYKELNNLNFDVSQTIVNEILSLPIYPEMSEEKANYVVSKIKEFYYPQ